MSMIGCFTAANEDTVEQIYADPGLIHRILYAEDGAEPGEFSIDVDKAWHGIHFALTGYAYGGLEPWCNVVLGGKEIGEDVGYGPARLITPMQVKRIAKALEPMTREASRSSINLQAMKENDIYPDIWDEGDEAVEYLEEYFEVIKAFYLKAADSNCAVLSTSHEHASSRFSTRRFAGRYRSRLSVGVVR